MWLLPSILFLRTGRGFLADDTAATLGLFIGYLEILFAAGCQILQVIAQSLPVVEVARYECGELVGGAARSVSLGAFVERSRRDLQRLEAEICIQRPRQAVGLLGQ